MRNHRSTSSRPVPRWARGGTRFLASLVAAMTGVLLLLSAPASAHVELISSTPTSGEHLSAAPTTVSLEFSEDIEPQFVTILLTVGNGSAQELEISAGSSPAVVVASVPPTETGAAEARWRIDYRVTSVDGHPIQGNFTFTVQGTTRPSASASASASGSASASASPSTSASAGTPTEESKSSAASPDGRSLSTDRWIWVAAPLLLLLALPALLVVARLARRDAHPVRPKADQE